MASYPPRSCCFVGVKHEGEATGELKEIAGTSTYIAYPPDNKSPEKAILFLTDVFGHSFINNQLIADQFAANGYLVHMPDLFHGNPSPVNRGPDFDIVAFRARNTFEVIDPVVEAAIKELRDNLGVKHIGAAGYCFGAKYTTRFLKKGKIDVGYVAHPSWVTVDEVLGIEGPLAIAAAEVDNAFPVEKRHETEQMLKDSGLPYQINLYSGVSHGFAVRGDLTNKQVLYAKEQAFIQAVTWFKEHVKPT